MAAFIKKKKPNLPPVESLETPALSKAPADTPCMSRALEFLKAAFPDAEGHTFLTLDDVEIDCIHDGPKSKKKRKNSALTFEVHGPLQECWAKLSSLSKEGAGVFYTVNETDLKGRKKENIKSIRGVWQEDDDGWTGKLPLEPHFVIETSPGRFHRLWLVNDLTMEEFDRVMETLVGVYGSDKNAKDVARVLRLPGTYHRKGKPFLTHVIATTDIPPYTREQILDAFPPVPKAPPSFTYQAIDDTAAKREAVASALECIEDDSWINWITIGKILKDEVGDAGLGLWVDWSKTSSKFVAGECEKEWAAFKTGSLKPASLGTIFWLAKSNGWAFPKIGEKQLAGDTALVRLVQHFASAGGVRLNRFNGKIELVGVPWTTSEALDDVGILRAQHWAHTSMAKGVGKAQVQDALTLVADDNGYDPLVDYLDSLEWDGVSRLDSWLSQGFGATDNPYTRGVGRMYLISAVARAMEPGCKVDTLLVLEGDQGAQKSSTLRALAGDEWFSDSISPMESKDSVMDLQGKWVIEISDLSTIKRSGIEAIKAFLSRQVDRCRPPYGRISQDFPRRCVLVGTTNESEYLKDPTGNRRYWPVSCAKADADWVKHNRDQLWAEAVRAFKTGEKWWPTDPELIKLVREEQASREQVDPWREPIAAFCEGKEIVSVQNLLCHLEIDKRQQTKVHQDRVAGCLISLGWTRRHLSLTGKKGRPWVYVAPDVTTISKAMKDAFLKASWPLQHGTGLVFGGVEEGDEPLEHGVALDDAL